MSKIKLFDKKFNSFTGMIFFKCIITECDFSMKYQINEINSLSDEDVLALAYQRDAELIDHLNFDHGLECLFKPVYETESTWSED